jgi:23S rRNA (guanosine2251-2'-O)-methyltransferase
MQTETVVILDNVRSAFNVGSIFRTCDGAGVKKLYLCGITPTKEHKKIKKTALGAEEYLDSEHIKDAAELITALKKDGFTIVSVEQTSDSIDYKEFTYPPKVAFIFGNEITGVDKNLITNSDRIIDIEMRGKKNSLNVATTVGIILYK